MNKSTLQELSCIWLVVHLIREANCSAWWISFYVAQIATRLERLVGEEVGWVDASVLIQANDIRSLLWQGHCLLP